MRLAFLLFLLAVLLLVCAAARGQDDEAPVRARVVCDGARVAVIQILATHTGLITIELPKNICGRSA